MLGVAELDATEALTFLAQCGLTMFGGRGAAMAGAPPAAQCRAFFRAFLGRAVVADLLGAHASLGAPTRYDARAGAAHALEQVMIPPTITLWVMLPHPHACPHSGVPPLSLPLVRSSRASRPTSWRSGYSHGGGCSWRA